MQLLIVLCLVALVCILGGAATTGLAILGIVLFILKALAWITGIALGVWLLGGLFLFFKR